MDGLVTVGWTVTLLDIVFILIVDWTVALSEIEFMLIVSYCTVDYGVISV